MPYSTVHAWPHTHRRSVSHPGSTPVSHLGECRIHREPLSPTYLIRYILLLHPPPISPASHHSVHFHLHHFFHQIPQRLCDPKQIALSFCQLRFCRIWHLAPLLCVFLHTIHTLQVESPIFSPFLLGHQQKPPDRCFVHFASSLFLSEPFPSQPSPTRELALIITASPCPSLSPRPSSSPLVCLSTPSSSRGLIAHRHRHISTTPHAPPPP